MKKKHFILVVIISIFLLASFYYGYQYGFNEKIMSVYIENQTEDVLQNINVSVEGIGPNDLKIVQNISKLTNKEKLTIFFPKASGEGTLTITFFDTKGNCVKYGSYIEYYVDNCKYYINSKEQNYHIRSGKN